jgi:hypothetical protein
MQCSLFDLVFSPGTLGEKRDILFLIVFFCDSGADVSHLQITPFQLVQDFGLIDQMECFVLFNGLCPGWLRRATES